MTLQRADTRQGYYSATNPSWHLGSPDHLTRLELSRFRSLPFLMISFDGSKPQNWSVTVYDVYLHHHSDDDFDNKMTDHDDKYKDDNNDDDDDYEG